MTIKTSGCSGGATEGTALPGNTCRINRKFTLGFYVDDFDTFPWNIYKEGWKKKKLPLFVGKFALCTKINNVNAEWNLTRQINDLKLPAAAVCHSALVRQYEPFPLPFISTTFNNPSFYSWIPCTRGYRKESPVLILPETQNNTVQGSRGEERKK